MVVTQWNRRSQTLRTYAHVERLPSGSRPQPVSHRCESLGSGRLLSDASRSRCCRHGSGGSIPEADTSNSVEHSSVRSFVVAFSVGATRPQTVSRRVAGSPLVFRPLLLERRSHSAELTPWCDAPGRRPARPRSAELPSLVSVFEREVTSLSAVQRRSRDRMCAGQGAIVTAMPASLMMHASRFPGPESTSCSGIHRSGMFAVCRVSPLSLTGKPSGPRCPGAFHGSAFWRLRV